MIEIRKIITNKQDSDVTLKFNIIPGAITRLSDIFRENSRKVITRLAICHENFH